jgi:hypothetical protein
MATSISSQQNKLLSTGFLDTLETSKEGLQPKESLAALYRLAGGLVVTAQKNLNRADRVASGELSDSIKVLDPRVVNGTRIIVDIEALSYYIFIDAGVKGTKSGSSREGFKYTNKMPPVNIIRKWLIKEGIKGRADKKYKLGGRDTFRKSITETSNSVAFAIAKNIQKKGLKQTNFFAKAITATDKKVAQELAKGFRIDIINSIPDNIGNTNSK